MLIGIVGTLCSGKHTTAEYLVQHHGFLRLHLPSPHPNIPLTSSSPTSSLSPSSSSFAMMKRRRRRKRKTVAAGASISPTNEHNNNSNNDSEDDDDNYSSDDNDDENWKRLLPSVTDEKGTRGLTFPDVDALLDFVTKRWREHWVLTDIHDQVTLEALLRRPFFMLVSVDAPVGVRFRRFNQRCIKRNLRPIQMEAFVDINDALLYGHRYQQSSNYHNNHKTSLTSQTTSSSKISTTRFPSVAAAAATVPSIGTISSASASASLSSRAHMHILNHQPSIPLYHAFLTSLDLSSPTRLRPPWDTYFMHLAHLASLRSNCMKRRVGCVLIHDNRIISTGYNGTPRNLRNCNEGGCARCNSGPGQGTGLSTCLCLHAEENALLEAGRERIRPGAVLYCDTCPCLTCSVKIAQVGVREVVYSQSYNMDGESRRVLAEAGVVLRQFSVPAADGLTVVGGDNLGGGGGNYDNAGSATTTTFDLPLQSFEIDNDNGGGGGGGGGGGTLKPTTTTTTTTTNKESAIIGR